MTEPQAILAVVVGAYGVLALTVGYLIGSMRTFASLGYQIEPLSNAWRTMLPFYGEPGWLRSRRHNR